MDPNRVEHKELISILINSLVQSKNLPIWISKEFSATPMLFNLSIFKGIRNEDPLTHIEYFIETFATYLIIDGSYYLMWFSITLKEGAYDWYHNHSLNTFLI